MTNNLRVVNIGSGPSKNDGDQLRVAFNKINLNFSDLVSGNIAVPGSGGIGIGNGYTGSRGEMGPTGSQGEMGPTGYQAVAANLMGAVNSFNDLPTENLTTNDAYYVSTEGNLYIWAGLTWINAGPIVGASGGQGPRGYSGSRGVDGIIGGAGYTGSRGNIGPSGASGMAGATGPQGTGISVSGTKASLASLTGITGTPGQAYILSSNGHLAVWNGTTWQDVGQFSGPRGSTGEMGPEGASGEIGPEGPPGPIGPSGMPGPSGIAGAFGPKGATGATGPIGINGYTGSVGPSGPQGVGATGNRGYAGSVGASGLAGSAAKIQTNIPTSSIGKSGDTSGDMVIDLDGGYLYVCSKNYDGSSLIWARLVITETSF